MLKRRMSTKTSTETELQSIDERPQQFGLWGVFLFLSLAAILCAIFAPLVRTLPTESYLSVGTLILAQIGAIAFSCRRAIGQRQALLEHAGRRLGSGYKHGPFGPGWVKAFAICSIVGFFAIQLAFLGFFLFMAIPTFDWLMIWNVIMLANMGGNVLLKMRQAPAIGATEIFENGLAYAGCSFMPWQLLRVRLSRKREQAIDITFHPPPRYASDTMVTLYVSDELREYLLKHHSEPEATEQ